MKNNRIVISLAPLLFELKDRGLEELNKSELNIEIKNVIFDMFSNFETKEAIEKLTEHDNQEIRSIGETLLWCFKSRRAKRRKRR